MSKEVSVLINDVKVDSSHVLSYVTNPKRRGCMAWTRYEMYSQYKSIAEYMECADPKRAMADLRYDESKGFLSIMLDGECINPKD